MKKNNSTENDKHDPSNSAITTPASVKRTRFVEEDSSDEEDDIVSIFSNSSRSSSDSDSDEEEIENDPFVTPPRGFNFLEVNTPESPENAQGINHNFAPQPAILGMFAVHQDAVPFLIPVSPDSPEEVVNLNHQFANHNVARRLDFD